LFQLWTLSWNAHAILTNPTRIWNAPIFYPYPNTLAFSDHHIFLAILALPLLANQQLVLAYNLLVMLSFVLSGWAVFLLMRSIFHGHQPKSVITFGAILAGSLFAFNTYRMSHLPHLQMLQTAWLPLALYWLRQMTIAQGRFFWFASVLTGVFAGIQGIAAIYYAPMTVLVLGILAGVWFWPNEWLDWRNWYSIKQRIIGLVVTACVAVAMMIPFFLPYIEVYQWLGIVRSSTELERGSAPLQAFLSVPSGNILSRMHLPVNTYNSDELNLFPGFLTITLASIGAWFLWRQSRRDGVGLITILGVAFVLSLGSVFRTTIDSEPFPTLLPYQWLYDWVPGMKALRVPARWWMIGSMALSVLAGIGAMRLFHYWRGSLIAIIAALALIEHLVIPIPRIDIPKVPAVYHWLAQTNPYQRRVILELPVPPRIGGGASIMRRQFYQTQHWRKILPGYSGLVPIGTSILFHQMNRLPDDDALRFLSRLGVDTLVIHRHELPDTEKSIALLAWAEQSPLLKRLVEVDGSLVYEIDPDPILNELPIAQSEVFLSGSEQIPGLLALSLQQRLLESGATIYGPSRLWFYPKQKSPQAGQVFDYVVLGQSEDYFQFGVITDPLWQGEGAAIYEVSRDVLAIYQPGVPDVGQLHARHPSMLNITLMENSIVVGSERILLRKSVEQAKILLEIASLSSQQIWINDQPIWIAAGGQTITVTLRSGQSITVRGISERFSVVRVQVWQETAILPDIKGAAIAVASAFEEAQYMFRIQLAGHSTILFLIQGAEAGTERPVVVAQGRISVRETTEVRLNVLQPEGWWLEQAMPAVDGRYIVYLKPVNDPHSVGIPIAKFNVHNGEIVDAVPLQLPLTIMR